MIIEVFDAAGRKKRFRRQVTVVDHDTGEFIHCPDNEDYLAWLRSVGVEAFFASHSLAQAKMVMIELE